jgi:hypothetical protein
MSNILNVKYFEYPNIFALGLDKVILGMAPVDDRWDRVNW